jgi:DNA-binding CsgD family transcriptional regulator
VRVAAVTDGLDHRRVAGIDPQPADGGRHGRGERVGSLIPHPGQQLLGRDRPPVGLKQALQHGELLRGQRQRHELAARLAGAVVGFAAGIAMVPPPAAAELLASPQCQEALGDGPFNRAEPEGAGMSLSAAAAYASRGRGGRRRPASGWDSLTPTELRVAADVSEGLSNPQIAARMLITRRTVTTHLTSIYRMIGVSTRAELAAAVTRHQRHDPGDRHARH